MVLPTQEAKHVACARCRERKVKCDGGKPSCRRCTRSGVTCQYVSGRKAHGKSEWVQHLRTFSSHPEKGSITRIPSESRSLKPSLLQLSRLGSDGLGSEMTSSYTRSPSPYLTESPKTLFNAGFDGSYSSYNSIGEPTSSPITPYTPEASVLFLQMLIFDSTLIHYNAEYPPDCVNVQPCVSSDFGMWGSYTPLSQASEATSGSFDGLIDASFPCTASSCCLMPSSSMGVADWSRNDFTSICKNASTYHTSSG